MKQPFAIHATTYGSKTYFPFNSSHTFENKLSSPLDDVDQYLVKLMACILSPLPTVPILVSCNILSESSPFFNDCHSPVLGVFYPRSGNVASSYLPVHRKSIDVIRCTVTDMHMKPLSVQTDVLVSLHFVPK